MAQETDREQSLERLGELINDVKIAMLTTLEEDGSLRSRPMATVNRKFDGDIYFFTHASAPKVKEVEHDQRVNVSYQSREDEKYISVSGRARLERDRDKMKEFWNPIYKAYFPKGLDDPDIGLLRIKVEKAEYWDSPSGAVVQLFGFVKALATGKPYSGEGSEHAKLELDRQQTH
jgi:general stress protein 26